ncbi:MAG: phage tail sheath family protein [Gammaproteobacteria bacterium]
MNDAYRTPGVYVEQTRPVDAPTFPTGVPVFVGFVEDSHQTGGEGEALPAPRFLTRWEQFGPFVGHAHRRGFLDYAVRGFFENGGGRCVVVPLQMWQREPSAVLQHVFEEGGLLDDVEDTDLVCVPDAMMEPEAAYQVQRAVLEHCRRKRDRFAILDAVPIHGAGHAANVRIDAIGIQTVIEHWRALLPGEGALYFPWLCVKPWPRSEYSQAAGRADHDASVHTRDNGPTAGGIDMVAVPPCGHVAGIYARTDRRVGVHKAPANEIVEGVLDLETEVTDEDQGVLNEVGVNCLRRFSGRGIRVWGARTLSGQPGWRYVNVRRLFLALTRWAERNLHEFVFEPNTAPLWERVRYRLASYCYGLFQQGALKGEEPAEAYYVKCDAETNPLEVREAGQLIAEVGLAAVAPAEFVIVHITQSSAQVSVSILVGP